MCRVRAGAHRTEIDALGSCVRQRIDAMETFVEAEAPHRAAHFPGQMLDRAAFDSRLVADAGRAGADCRRICRVCLEGLMPVK